MKKTLGGIYLIKDLARLTMNSVYTVKYYCKLGLVKEAGKTPFTNFRYFNDSAIKRLKNIRELRKKGYKISRIKEIVEKKQPPESPFHKGELK